MISRKNRALRTASSPLVFAMVALILAGCSPTAPIDALINPGQKFEGNVSTLYGAGSKLKIENNRVAASNISWKNEVGKLQSLDSLKGKIIVVNFWATWCPYCINEMPDLEAIAVENPDDVVVLGVSIDDAGDVFKKVQDFTNARGFTYQMIVDQNWKSFVNYTALTGTTSIPQTFIIARDGFVRTSFVGQTSKSRFLKSINELR